MENSGKFLLLLVLVSVLACIAGADGDDDVAVTGAPAAVTDAGEEDGDAEDQGTVMTTTAPPPPPPPAIQPGLGEFGMRDITADEKRKDQREIQWLVDRFDRAEHIEAVRRVAKHLAENMEEDYEVDEDLPDNLELKSSFLECTFEDEDCLQDFPLARFVRTSGDQAPPGGHSLKPPIDHTLGTKHGKYRYADVKRNRTSRSAMTSQPLLAPVDGEMCVRFWVYNDGDSTGALTVLISNSTTFSELIVLPDVIAGIYKATWQKYQHDIDLDPAEQFRVVMVVVQTGGNATGGFAVDDVSVLPGTCDSITETCESWSPWGPCSVSCGEGGEESRERTCKPVGHSMTPREVRACRRNPCATGRQVLFSCSFEDPCDRLLVEDLSEGDFTWFTLQGPTPTASTGPDYDHTKGDNTGKYVYTEASTAREGDVARLVVSPNVAATVDVYCLMFWYHMYGKDIGSLIISWTNVRSKVMLIVFNKTGNYGNYWKRGVVELDTVRGESYRLTFDAERGKSFRGDIALDDVSLRSGPCDTTAIKPGPWESWTACSASCGHGHKTRNRPCPADKCEGKLSERQTCIEQPCPEPQMTPWSTWSDCSETCGIGQRTRERDCVDEDCGGMKTETRACYRGPCPAPFKPWNDWAVCTRFCGGGVRRRTRECSGIYCVGPTTESESCNQSPCAVGPWSEWSECTAVCDSGTRTRTRYCADVIASCTDDLEETEPCPDLPPCGQWGTWSECSVTCGAGFRSRVRQCDGKVCPNARPVSQLCVQRACRDFKDDVVLNCTFEQVCEALEQSNRDDGQWTWHSGKTTSHDTGPQHDHTKGDETGKYMYYETSNPIRPGDVAVLKAELPNPDRRELGCLKLWYHMAGQGMGTLSVGVSGVKVWAKTGNQGDKWQEAIISLTLNTRTRFNITFAGTAGDYTSDMAIDDVIVTIGDNCPVKGVTTPAPNTQSGGDWDDWSRWSACSQTCGDGMQGRSRDCRSNVCPVMTESRPCPAQTACDDDWDGWGEWKPCSASCDGGIQYRTRNCKVLRCTGPLKDYRLCSQNVCKGNWDNWGDWGQCSKSCGRGERFRKRRCYPGNCDGDSIMVEPCNIADCGGATKP